MIGRLLLYGVGEKMTRRFAAVVLAGQAFAVFFGALVAYGISRADEDGNRLEDILVSFDIDFGEGEGADRAREVLPKAIQRSHDRLCTVGRTVERGTPIATRTVD